MGEKLEKQKKDKGSERLWRFGRDFNIVVGVGALAVSTVLAPAAAAVAGAYGAFNLAQAGGFEALRRHQQKKRLKRQKPSG